MTPWDEEGADRERAEDRRRRCLLLAEALEERERRGGAPLAVLRHSVREPIVGASLAAATGAALTEDGRELARFLARALPREPAYRLFASPVTRCVETASILVEAVVDAGGEAALVGKRSYLAGDFIRDPGPVINVFAAEGPRGFMRAWHAGSFPEGAIDPPERAARGLLGSLLAEQENASSRCIDLHVGHDLTVATLLGLVTISGEGLGWPGFLEGLLLWRDGGALRLWFRGTDHAVALTG